MNAVTSRFWTRAATAGLTLLTLAANALAQEDYVVDAFDSEDTALLWTRWWGAAAQTYEFDPSMDADARSSSGSLKSIVEFDLATHGGDNQFAVLRNFDGGATVDATKYTNLVFSVRWDPGSPKRAGGDFGYLEYGFRNSDWSQTWLGGTTIPADAADGWMQIRAAIDPSTAKLSDIAGVVLKLWSGSEGGLTGTTTFWTDNVKLIASTNQALPPPTMQLTPAAPGLQIAASAPGQQYQRQNIRTQAADADGNATAYSWVDRSGPVTYSITIKDYPSATYGGFQTHLFLAPEAGMPYGPGDTSIDWNTPNIVFVQIANNADGTASAQFLYKTNLPSGNAMLWNQDPTAGPVGNLGGLTDPSPLGTWSVTFRNNTEITLTAPSGNSTNLAMPAGAAALFADPLYVYVGTQPNQVANIGQSALLGRVQITGVPTPLDDTFAGATFDAAKWQVVAPDAAGIQPIPADARYWLKWTAPATGFVVESSTSPIPGGWTDAGLSNVVQIGAQKAVIVPAANLPSPDRGFFRLAKPAEQ